MKNHFFHYLLMVVLGVFSVVSCNNKEESQELNLNGNSFIYADQITEIQSVVYTVDEDNVYTFYFSPTPGLVDLDAMLLADDYIKVVTKTPTGEFDLLQGNNRLVYQGMNVTSGSQVSSSEIFLQLTSVTTANMNFCIVAEDGSVFKGLYKGTCIRSGDASTNKPEFDAVMDKQIFGYFFGETKASTNEYQIALTNAEWTGSATSFSLTSEGYAVVLDFCGAIGETWRELPTGTFSESDKLGVNTFVFENSGVIYHDAEGNNTTMQLLDPLVINRDAKGIYTVTAKFIDAQYKEHSLIYTGELNISNATLNVALPQMERDVLFEGAYASGIYEGDVLDNGNGLTEITINDKSIEAGEAGYIMRIALFNEKFLDPKREARLIPGTYKAAKTNAQGTWMQTYEVNFMGMILPMGTYVAYSDGVNDEYGYAVDGTIVVKQGSSKNNFTIMFELTTLAGHKITGSYTGDIYIEDQSNDDKNDGTSNLTKDYELNLDHHKRANCFQPETIWIRGLDNITIPECCAYSGREYGFQHIQIGTQKGTYVEDPEYPVTGKLFEGDIIDYDLIVEKGEETRIRPGTYPIATNRYPVLFYPGVCVPGYNCYYGTSMGRVNGVIGWGYPSGYYDPDYKADNGWLNVPTVNVFASIYSGSVTIEKALGGDNYFKISVDGKDVLKHHITGSWTGPIYLGTSDTPALESEVVSASAAPRKAASASYPTILQVKNEASSTQVNKISFLNIN